MVKLFHVCYCRIVNLLMRNQHWTATKVCVYRDTQIRTFVSMKLDWIYYFTSLPVAVGNFYFTFLFMMCDYFVLTSSYSSPHQQSEWDLYSFQTSEHHSRAFAKLFGLPDASWTHSATCECFLFLEKVILNVTRNKWCVVIWTHRLWFFTSFLLYQLFFWGSCHLTLWVE